MVLSLSLFLIFITFFNNKNKINIINNHATINGWREAGGGLNYKKPREISNKKIVALLKYFIVIIYRPL